MLIVSKLTSRIAKRKSACAATHSRTELADQIHWQTGASDACDANGASADTAPHQPAALRVLTGAIADPLLRARLDFLARLERVANGERDAVSASRAPQPLDEVGARLPARYRRAYRYLLANLERKDLSIREIAAQIGVTERALQSAFKASLGATPTEIVRRLRMERMRADLEQTAAARADGVLATAVKWGVSSRSTLVSRYRRQFDELPSQTLNR
jgi:AraC-like DNA-binding protein